MSYALKEIKQGGFGQTIRNCESTDKEQKRLSPEFFNLGEMMDRNGGINAVPYFAWFSDCDTKSHYRDGKKYVEILVTRKLLQNIFLHMKTFMDNNKMGYACMKAWSCAGVFIRFDGKTQWQYPSYKKNQVNPMEVQNLIETTSDEMRA